MIDESKDIIVEARSAKASNNRPLFTSMLEKIRQGEYDGIIALHPDRLCRNMKEAGEIIDMLDRGEIKDLIFPTVSFENTPSGLMMLGLLFVMAKEYSDKLSMISTWGTAQKVMKGKHFKIKHGYYRDDDFLLRPDGKNADLIREAFNMKLRGKTHQEIIKYLNANNYQKQILEKDPITKVTNQYPETFKMTKSTLSRILAEPFYAGILRFGQKQELVVNLKEEYDFVPLVTTDDFLKLNPDVKNDYLYKARASKYASNTFLKDQVHCECGNLTYHSTGKNIKYMRCLNKKCKAPSKFTNIKKVIFPAAADKLRKLSEKEIKQDLFPQYEASYKIKVQHEETVLNKQLDVIKGNKISVRAKISKFNKDLEKTADTTTLQVISRKIKEFEDKFSALDIEEAEAKQQLAKLNQTPNTIKEFCELLAKMPDWIEKTDDFDKVCYVVANTFANFTVNGKKVLDCQLNPDFEVMGSTIKPPDVSDGDPTGNEFELA
ncbi:hypothetical protein GF389_06405 [Candidatus Dojkabacteria bacterium]|nr:hypothetical protein [Candidatus Dojkabacteria bacterium]